MNHLRIRSILSGGVVGQSVTVCGWVRSKRASKGIAFLVISDGSAQDTLQLVIAEDTPAFHVLPRCSTGTAIKAVGMLKESPGKGQRFEVEVSDLDVFGTSASEAYPLQKKGHTLEFLREIGHLRPRTNTYGAVFRIRNILAHGVHEFFQNRGFIWVHTPIITSSDCEGAGELFTVTGLDLDDLSGEHGKGIDFAHDFFGTRAYLTVSGQLEAEFMAMAMGDVLYIRTNLQGGKFKHLTASI